jgi:predicted small secreted protein
VQWSALRRSAFVSAVSGRKDMLRKITTLILIGGSLAIAACNTVRGAAADVNSVANTADNAM